MTLRKRNRRRQKLREKNQSTEVVVSPPEETTPLPVKEVKAKTKTTRKKSVRVCSVCKEEGHTKRLCPTLKETKEKEPPTKKWWQNKE